MPDATFIDPLGRAIVLHDRTWYAHVLRGHADMAAYRPLVENAVADPVEIRYSTWDADCRLYYGAGPRDGLLVAVVADVVAGRVKTAYLTRRRSAGDLEWSSPTP